MRDDPACREGLAGMSRSEPWKTSGMVSFTNDIAMIADWLAPAEGVKVVFQRDRNIEVTGICSCTLKSLC